MWINPSLESSLLPSKWLKFVSTCITVPKDFVCEAREDSPFSDKICFSLIKVCWGAPTQISEPKWVNPLIGTT